jgi:hypothetical protein
MTFVENKSRAASFAVLGAFGAWVLVRWLWPWCGPLMLAPCPLATTLGCQVALGIGGLWGFVKALELELEARRRFAPPALPRERRISRPMSVIGCATRTDATPPRERDRSQR